MHLHALLCLLACPNFEISSIIPGFCMSCLLKFQWREMRDPKCSNHYSISEDNQDHALQSARFQRSGASILVQIGDITRN